MLDDSVLALLQLAATIIEDLKGEYKFIAWPVPFLLSLASDNRIVLRLYG
jgi:hypothetical protein